METNKIKTIAWMHCDEIFLRNAREVWGKDLFSSRPTDFMKFVASLPDVTSDILNFWIYRMIDGYKFQDFTQSVVLNEDNCLFASAKSEEAPVLLNILLTYLQDPLQMKTGWHFVDTEKKALVHFVKRNATFSYCELYCLGSENASYLHAINDGYWNFFIPVNFMNDVDAFNLVISNKVTDESGVLRDYLPKDKFDLLSRRRQKTAQPEQKGQSKKSYPVDRGDML